MIHISPIKRSNKLIGFKVSGHANYAPYGSDIVCAAISTISINTVNSIQLITGQYIEVEERDGYLKYSVENPRSNARTLLESALIGYSGIAEQYPEYVVIATSQ